MNEAEKNQVEMHKDFFVRCEKSIKSGFYLEAILMEYAAIESRLESICGVLGFPCGKDCICRKDVLISSRIECLRKCRNNNPELFAKSKLPFLFFTEKGNLNSWIGDRNRIVHGLYKNEIRYQSRIKKSKELSEKGLEYSKCLYDEVKRLRRIRTNHPQLFDNIILICQKENCKAFKAKKE